jgi:hypothetical protein
VLKPEELKTFMGRLGALKVPSDYCSGKTCNGQEAGEYEKP